MAALAALPALAGCAADRAREADRAYTAGLAQVLSVAIELDFTSNPGARAIVRGILPDACTKLDRIDQFHLGSQTDISITTRRPWGAMCAAAVVPFERTILIDRFDLETGIHTVTVNGVSNTFTVIGDPFPDWRVE